jgi:hypothetical protein
VPLVEQNREKATAYYKRIIESPRAEEWHKNKARFKLGLLAEATGTLENAGAHAELYYRQILESPSVGEKIKNKALLQLAVLAEKDPTLENRDARLNNALQLYSQMSTLVGHFYAAVTLSTLGKYAESQIWCDLIMCTEPIDKKLLNMIHALRATNGIQLQSDPYTIVQDLKMMFQYAPSNREFTHWNYLNPAIGDVLKPACKKVLDTKEQTAESADLLATYVWHEICCIKRQQVIRGIKDALPSAEIIRLLPFAIHAAKLNSALGKAVLGDLGLQNALQQNKPISEKVTRKPTVLPMRSVDLFYNAYKSDDPLAKGIALELLRQLADVGHLPAQAIFIAQHKNDLDSLNNYYWWKEPVYTPSFDVNLDKDALLFLKELLDTKCIKNLHDYAENNPYIIALPLFLMNLHTQNAVNIFNTPNGKIESYDFEEMESITQNLLNMKPYYFKLLNHKLVPDWYKTLLKEPTYRSIINAGDIIGKSRQQKSKQT